MKKILIALLLTLPLATTAQTTIHLDDILKDSMYKVSPFIWIDSTTSIRYAPIYKIRKGSTITVTNEAWNCGAYTPAKAYVIQTKKGKLLIKFDYVYQQKHYTYKTLANALNYWQWEGTTIVKIKY